MSTTITLTGPVTIDGYNVTGPSFTGTGDGTVQTFVVDLSEWAVPGSKVLGMSASCLSDDGITLYPVGTGLGAPGIVGPSVSVQVPTGVDFILSVSVAVGF